jgi:tripartite-type tricarboxylate transporter receptor subunit TctC
MVLTSLLLSICLPAEARQQDSLKIVVPFAAGGATDLSARILAEAITIETGRRVVVENRPGGFTTVALDYVMRQPADGNTLFIAANGVTTQRYYVPNAPADPITQLSIVSVLVESPMLLLASNRAQGVPTSNLQDLIAFARQNPEVINYPSVGQGGTLQMATDLFLNATNTRMTSIAYTGEAPAVADLIAGRLQMMFISTPAGSQLINNNSARALGVTANQRSRVAPNVPTFREQGLDVNFTTWQAIFVSAATPEPVRQRVNETIRKALQNPSIVQRYLDIGMDRVINSTVSESQDHLNREMATWRAILAR